MFCQWNLAIGRSPVNFSDAKYGQGIKKMNSVGGIEDQTIQKAFRDIDPKALNIFQSSLKELRSYYPDAWSSTGDMKTTLSKPQRIRPVKKTPKNTPLSSVLSKVDH